MFYQPPRAPWCFKVVHLLEFGYDAGRNGCNVDVSNLPWCIFGAEAGSIDSHCAERSDVAKSKRPRIDFNGDLGIGRDLETSP